MSYSEDSIRDLVRRVLLRTLGPDGIVDSQPAAGPGNEQATRRPTVTEAAVLATPKGGQIPVPSGALVTPLARDAARDRGVTFIQGPGLPAMNGGATSQNSAQAQPGSPSRSTAGQRTVAIGADHGGYAAKEDLKAYLGELSYEIIDCGTHSAESVDYPDLAYAVAQLVSEGRAWRGVIIDGAGIGSCMAANKVPGVRAAMCYDHATAINSRAHNDANVLSLGGLLLGSSLARQIVKVWLETDFEGGRHARRVDKIMAIESRFRAMR